MSDLVSLPEAKAQLRIPLDQGDEDLDILMKLQAAEAIVLSHLTQRDDGEWDAIVAAWTASTVPRAVKQAILIQLVELVEFRGDDLNTPQRAKGALSDTLESLLMAYKDPGVA